MAAIHELFQIAIERSASDLHIVPNYFPTIRVNEELYAIRTTQPYTNEMSTTLLSEILTENQKTQLVKERQIDFSYSFDNNRFRSNIYFVKGAMAGTFRVITPKIKTIAELTLPTIFYEFAKLRSGLVLITGPTGEGKSTSLAAVINEINTNQTKHIITIEDPIEFMYPVAKSIVSQRELHSDTTTFGDALRGALREDPDVLLVGEMRDLETTQSALTMAETGHLVFSTLHTSTAVEAVNRILDMFPSHQQNLVRSQLAGNLKAIVSQRLIPTVTKAARVPALEILINTPAVSNIIREQKLHQMDNLIETGEEQGMLLFEKYLLKLYQNGTISKDIAYKYALRPNEIIRFIP